MSIEDDLKRFSVENFYVTDPSSLKANSSLIEGGYIELTRTPELIVFLEAECGIPIADTENTPENLGMMGRIARFVGGGRPAANRGKGATA